MSSTLARSASRPPLSPRWTKSDVAATQGDRSQGARAARAGADGVAFLDRFWRQLADEGANDLLRLYGECERQQRAQDAGRERLRNELDTSLVSQAHGNQRQHEDRMSALRREAGSESILFKERAAKAEEAQKALRAVRGEVNSRPLRTQFGPFYPLMMFVLALAEVPVNRAAFELTFREEPILSLLLAAAVGVILIFFAHVIGLILRRWPQRPNAGQVAARLATLTVILGVVGAGVYVLAKMRQGFMRLTAAENDGFAQRLQEALRGGAQEAASIIADVPLSIGDWTFIAINILIFMFGVVASFLRHDPHPDYEQAVREEKRTARACAKVEKRYDTAAREETIRYEERKRSLEVQMGELRARISDLASDSDNVWTHCASSRLEVARTVHRRCVTFADGFSAALASGNPPVVPTFETILDALPVAEAVRAG